MTSTMLRAFFKYFGAKHRAISKYPAPVNGSRIIEPFAGSAAYSTRWANHEVLLVDKDPNIVGVWQYLIAAKPSEIRSLPVFKDGQTHIDELGPLMPEARSLIGFWLFTGSTTPRVKRSSWAQTPEYADRFWGEHVRERIASQVENIRHWKVIHGSYEDCPDVVATWFIDPPYEIAGNAYAYPSRDIDYQKLSEWVRSRRGLVVVCENEGASWLPHTSFVYDGTANNSKVGRISREVVCIMNNTSEYSLLVELREKVESVKNRLATIDKERNALDRERDGLLSALKQIGITIQSPSTIPDNTNGSAIQRVVNFLKVNPDSKRGDIERGLSEMPSSTVRNAVYNAVKLGAISKSGTRGQSTYRAA